MQTGMQIGIATLVDSTHTRCDAHWEKHLSECVVWFIFGRKDTNKVQHNMQAEGIQQHLWLRQHLNNQHKILKSHVLFVLTTAELDPFLSRTGSMKFLTNYGASLAKHVVDKKLGSMKSYDYHMFMQQLCLSSSGNLWLLCDRTRSDRTRSLLGFYSVNVIFVLGFRC